MSRINVTSAKQADKLMLRGMVLLVIGLIITVGSLALAPGGIVIVSFGPIILGVVYLVKGSQAKARFGRN